MALNLTIKENPEQSQQAADHGIVHKTGYGYLPVGRTKDDCKQKAEQEGGVAWDQHAQACWLIYGKAVKITDIEHSIMEGFEVVNFNFRAQGGQPAVPTQESLPGPNTV